MAPSTPSNVLRVRSGSLLGATDDDVTQRAVVALARGESFEAPDDPRLRWAFVPDLVHAALDLLIDDERGTWSLSHCAPCTPFELIVRVAGRLGVRADLLVRVPARSSPRRRRSEEGLASEREFLLPPLDRALDRLAAAIRPRIDAIARHSAADPVFAGVTK
jgi:dTDP-4-dehydrorhamnose reductase